MTFNPELGSTSPAVLLDNAQRLDKLVNGPALTEPDRAGDDLDTWRGMMAKSNAAIDDAQNSITILGLPFATLADAQAAVDAGKIPDGAITWIRNDDASLADEYINNGGILSATGRKMPSQEYIDDGFTPGRVVESDTDVAIALTFAEGSRSWLESDYDGGPTEHSAKLIGKAINIGDSPDSDKNVAIALTFAEGSRSWLESDYDGGPTEYAAEKIAEAINWSPPASESQTVPLSTAPDGTAREYPTFKRLSAPIIQFSQQSAPTVYWPWIVNKSAWGGTGFALFYSTDHSATHDPSGIFCLRRTILQAHGLIGGKYIVMTLGGGKPKRRPLFMTLLAIKFLCITSKLVCPGLSGSSKPASLQPTPQTSRHGRASA